MRIADEAQRRFGRKVSWGASCGDSGLVHDPVRAGDDATPDGGAAGAGHADRGGRGAEPGSRPGVVRPARGGAPGGWLKDLREALKKVRAVRGEGPTELGLATSVLKFRARGSRRQEHGREGTGASPSPDFRRAADPRCHPRAVAWACSAQATPPSWTDGEDGSGPAPFPASRSRSERAPDPDATWTDLGPDDKWAKDAIDHVAGTNDGCATSRRT